MKTRGNGLQNARSRNTIIQNVIPCCDRVVIPLPNCAAILILRYAHRDQCSIWFTFHFHSSQQKGLHRVVLSVRVISAGHSSDL
jgi:hypothetical protein